MRCYKSYDTKKFFEQKNLELAVEKIMSMNRTGFVGDFFI